MSNVLKNRYSMEIQPLGNLKNELYGAKRKKCEPERLLDYSTPTRTAWSRELLMFAAAKINDMYALKEAGAKAVEFKGLDDVQKILAEQFVIKLGLMKFGTDSEIFGGFGRFAEGKYILAVRGTKTITDWAYNLDASQSPDTICNNKRAFIHNDSRSLAKSHTRDTKTALNFMKQVTALVSEPTVNEVIICGHSLGAALATLTAYHLSQTPHAHKISNVVLLGSPRLGNYAFRRTIRY